MITLWKRLKNIWRLSEYRVDNSEQQPKIKKDVPTIQRKLATIIKEKEELFPVDEGDLT